MTSQHTSPEIGSLRDFLKLLKSHGQCINWSESVRPEEDIRSVAVAAGRDVMSGPAIIFDNIQGYPNQKTVVGVHGSFGNLALLLGKPVGTSVRELFFELIDRWGKDKADLRWVEPDEAPVMANRVEKKINLYELLPLYRINEYDGGFYLAKASIVSRDPQDTDNFDKQNVGIYRVQVHQPDRLTILSVPSHDMGRQIMAAERLGKPLKVAIMLGNHPAMSLFAGTPIGYEESEFSYASAMMGQPLHLTKSGNGLDILAQSEMIIEAELVHGEREFEGPFGEFPGSYSGVRKVPVFKITAVNFRDDPIFESIYIGKGWTEHDTLIGLNTSAPLYSVLKKDFPEVTGVNAMYQHGLTAIISVHNRFAGFAKSVAMRALGTPHGLMYLKNLIMVDGDVDPFNLEEVMWALSTRTRDDDIMVLPNMAMVPIDPAAKKAGKGHHLVIDATSYLPPDVGEETPRIVTPPSGSAIDALLSQIKSMQNGGKL